MKLGSKLIDFLYNIYLSDAFHIKLILKAHNKTLIFKLLTNLWDLILLVLPFFIYFFAYKGENKGKGNNSVVQKATICDSPVKYYA